METYVRLEPMDQYNQAHLEDVHPPQWENPRRGPQHRYNLIVVGAGTAGLVTAAVPAPAAG